MFQQQYQDALIWAIQKHGDQTYGELAYHHHLSAVERQLYIYNFHPSWKFRKLSLSRCEDLLLAVLLHDIVEDTAVEITEVEERFGNKVAGLVWAVTNGPVPPEITEKSERRKIKFASVYPKIKETEDAIIVKLCDRIANVESCISHRLTKDRVFAERKLSLYQSEYLSFREALYHPGDNHINRMWKTLDSLLIVPQAIAMKGDYSK